MTYNHLFFIPLFFFSCVSLSAPKASPEETAIRKEVQDQPARAFHGGVASVGTQAILVSKSLTQNQKDNLMKIHGRMMRETFKIQDEISMLKGLLFQTMTTRPYNDKKIEALKKELIELNNKKIRNMLTAIDEVQKIVKKAPEDEYKDIISPFFQDHTR